MYAYMHNKYSDVYYFLDIDYLGKLKYVNSIHYFMQKS